MTDAVKMDIERFVRTHQDGLRRYLMLLGCDIEAANDLAQETFLVLLRKDLTFDEESSAAAFLRKCAFNLLRDSKKSERRRLAILRKDAAEQIWNRYQLDDQPDDYRLALVDCQNALPEGMNEVINLFYRRGMSGREVAEAQDLSESLVWTTLTRAREKLRLCIDRKLNHDT